MVNETKIIKVSNPNLTVELSAYNEELAIYNKAKLEEKPLPDKPIPPKTTIDKEFKMTIPQFTTKTKYSFDWKNLKIITKIIKIPVMKDIEVTESKLKDGYSFDEDSGNFYEMEKC